MEKKFGFLRIIGTIWKVLAWVVLIAGLLASIGMLLTSVFGGEMMRRFAPPEQVPWIPRAFGITGGVVTSVVSLIVTVMYFLMLYAVGEFIYLLLAIEENTRMTARLVQVLPAPQPAPVAPPSFAPPPPPPPPDPRL